MYLYMPVRTVVYGSRRVTVKIPQWTSISVTPHNFLGVVKELLETLVQLL